MAPERHRAKHSQEVCGKRTGALRWEKLRSDAAERPV